MPTKFVTNPRRPAAKKSRVPMRRNYASASVTDNYLRDLRPAQVERLVREGALDITYSDIGNGYHTVTLFEQGRGENYRQVEAKWFVKGDDAWYDLSLGLRDGKVDPSTADLFLGPSRWDKREREEQTRAAAKRKGIDIDASRHYFNNPRRKNPRGHWGAPGIGFRRGEPLPGPSVKMMVARLGISKVQAQELKDLMNAGEPDILGHADYMMSGNGVERISGRPGLMFVNMGDTYDTTLIYDYKTNRFVVSSWGDIVERQPRRFDD